MPQTRFVLSKALALGHKVIIVVNKTDRPDAPQRGGRRGGLRPAVRPGRQRGAAGKPDPLLLRQGGQPPPLSRARWAKNLDPLFDAILEDDSRAGGRPGRPAAAADLLHRLQRLCRQNRHRPHLPRHRCTSTTAVIVCDYHNPDVSYRAEGRHPLRVPGPASAQQAQTATVGDIVCVSGIDEPDHRRDHLCAPDCAEPLPFVKISEPTVEMTFSVNNSPFAGPGGQVCDLPPPARPPL